MLVGWTFAVLCLAACAWSEAEGRVWLVWLAMVPLSHQGSLPVRHEASRTKGVQSMSVAGPNRRCGRTAPPGTCFVEMLQIPNLVQASTSPCIFGHHAWYL